MGRTEGFTLLADDGNNPKNQEDSNRMPGQKPEFKTRKKRFTEESTNFAFAG